MFGLGKKKNDDGEQPIMVVEGNGGALALFHNRVELSHKGLLSFMTLGYTGDKTIYLHQVAGVQIKKPGLVTKGYIQLIYMGSQENKGGLFSATSDENTVFIADKKQHEKALEFKRKVEEMLASKQGSGESNSVSVADELEKLASLKERGLLSDDEFAALRKKLL